MAEHIGNRIEQQFGDYRRTRLLGKGSFGDVYLGEHVHDHTLAAVKVLQARLTAEDLKEFINETSTIFRMKHPNIVQLLDFGIAADDTAFLVMDYAPNGNLRQLHPKGTRLPLELVLPYVKQIAAALQYAHDKKRIHRDVKPENILLGPNNEVLLSDFGIAVMAYSTRSFNIENQGGTVPYMAPEQLQGKPRPASDQYALGIIVYEWLYGERPFNGTATEIAMQHMLTPPPPLREKVSTISPEVEQVVLTALAKDPKDRFDTVQAFATALEQAAQPPRTVTPPPQSLVADGSLDKLPPPQRDISRRTVVLGLVGLATVAVAGGSIALLTHTQPSQHPTPTVAAPKTPTSAVAAPNPAISSAGAMFGYDLAHTHFNPDEHILSSTNVSRLVPLWSAAMGGIIDSSPAVANGVVYVGSSDSKLYAFEAGKSKSLWSAATGAAITSSPAVAKGVVYVGSSDSKLYAFEAGTGKPLWSAATGGPIYFSSPAVADGVIYVGSSDSKLYAFEAGTGNLLWSTTTGNLIDSSPAVANGVVYVGSRDNKLYAFEAGMGNLLWSAATGNYINSSPAVANGVVYVGSHDHKLYAFEAGMGKPLWSAATVAAITSSPAVANGVVYVGSQDKNLYAFEADTGKPLWSALTDGYITSSPAVANGVVYVGSYDKKLYAFEAGTGKPLWSAPTGREIHSPPAVANGVVYVGSYDKKLYAFHLPGTEG